MKTLKDKGIANPQAIFRLRLCDLGYHLVVIQLVHYDFNTYFLMLTYVIIALLSQRPLCPIYVEIMNVMEIMESHSVHYLHTVQNFMRHFVRQFFAFFQKCEPTSYGKLHICSTFLSPVKRDVNRSGFRPVFSVFYFIISIPF